MEIQELMQSMGPHTTPAETKALLEHPDTQEAHVLAALKKRNLASAAIETVASHERWNQRHAVKAAIVNHPKAPKTLTLRLLNLLFWQELLRVCGNFRLQMPVRVEAENQLSRRLPQLELGEKISLARSAPRRVILQLIQDAHPRIVEALLTNPRLQEVEVVSLSESPGTPPEVLRAVARSERWVTRPPIKLAVVKNPRTPAHTALRLLATLPKPTIAQLLKSHELPRLVSIRAEQILSE